MNFTCQIQFKSICQQNGGKVKLKMKKSLSLGFMSVVLPSHILGGKQRLPPYIPSLCMSNVPSLFPQSFACRKNWHGELQTIYKPLDGEQTRVYS